MKLAIALLSLVAVAFAQTVHQIPVKEVRVVGEVPAEWWTYVRVGGGVPFTYTVPADQRFVLTSIENTPGDIQANGTNCWIKVQPARPGSFANGTRVVFEPGNALWAPSVADLWGYLEPVR